MATTLLTGRSRPAFTLIELLVVIVVIGVLLTLVVAVGSRVVSGGKASLRIESEALNRAASRMYRPTELIGVRDGMTTPSTTGIILGLSWSGSSGSLTIAGGTSLLLSPMYASSD